MRREEPSALSNFLLSLLIFLFISETQAGNLQPACSSSCGDITNISYPFRLKSDPVECELLILTWPMEAAAFQASGDSAYKRLPCLSDQSDNVYVNIGGYREEISDLPESSYCSFISMVPILHADVIRPSYEVIQNLLKFGFDVRWSIGCRDCIKVDGYCKSNRCYMRPLDGLEELLLYYPKFMVQLLAPFYLGYHWKPELIVPGEMFGIDIFIILRVFEFFFDTWLAVIGDRVEIFLHNQQSWMLKRYSYSEIVAITNHFKEELGQGGFGSVYKGQLHSGSLTAVKVLKNSNFNVERIYQ
ncbi:hypothetical protein Patl1_15170 [Pistacia atlantica]|uniref:Uncharacterized protein n=1 Tax=Pistacia atlantica TaxID=434234 RepID=A0ACC1B8A2_9ROSI|nr:hypothetical protein Patl1_15170 [Pistacia atlantica]